MPKYLLLKHYRGGPELPTPVRDDPSAVLSRAVAVGHVLGPDAGLREVDRLAPVLGDRFRLVAVRPTCTNWPVISRRPPPCTPPRPRGPRACPSGTS